MLPRQTKNNATPGRAERQLDKPANRPTIRLLCNGSVHQEVSFDRPRLLIGRSENNDLSIPSRYVSRHHILLLEHGGSTILIDLDSVNGTFVNSERVSNHVLKNGDEITIDQQSLFVQYAIQYDDPLAATHDASASGESAARAIRKALADIRHLLGKGETDLLPTLREDVPTVMGIIDDR